LDIIDFMLLPTFCIVTGTKGPASTGSQTGQQYR
jgi:hypothetical protein